MPSSVNRHRRQHAFTRGFDRPQGTNPYANPVLAALWQRGREKRLAQSGGVMPPLPMRSSAPSARPPSKLSPRSQQGGGGGGGRSSPPPGRGRPGGSGGGGGGQHRGWR